MDNTDGVRWTMHCREGTVRSERSLCAEPISKSEELPRDSKPSHQQPFKRLAVAIVYFNRSANSWLFAKTLLANYWFGTKATSSTLFTFTIFVMVLVGMLYS